MKDLFSLELLSVVLSQALKIVKPFRKAKQYLGIFCKHQQAIYGEKRALIAFTILHWEIQIDHFKYVAQTSACYNNMHLIMKLFSSQKK